MHRLLCFSAPPPRGQFIGLCSFQLTTTTKSSFLSLGKLSGNLMPPIPLKCIHPTQLPSGLRAQLLVTAQAAEAPLPWEKWPSRSYYVCFQDFPGVAVDFQPLCLVRKHLELSDQETTGMFLHFLATLSVASPNLRTYLDVTLLCVCVGIYAHVYTACT